jgi:GTP-binding protein Era
MVKAAFDSIYDADQIVLIVDAAKNDLSASLEVAQKLTSSEKPKILALNKVDLLQKEKLLEIIGKFAAFGFDHIFMISATNGDGVTELTQTLCDKSEPGPWFYMEDQSSDLPRQVQAEEMTREKIYEFLHQELPYSIHVVTESFEIGPKGDIKIVQSIVVERDSQKGIVLGDRGSKLKSIGTASRKDLQDLFGAKVHLFLHVTVDEKWQNRKSYYEQQGLEFES